MAWVAQRPPVVQPLPVRIGDGALQLLAERIRLGYLLLLFSVGLFGLGDLWIGGPRLVPLMLIKVVQIGSILWALSQRPWQIQAPKTVRLVWPLICLASAAACSLRGDTVTMPLLGAIAVITTATLLPWGARMQIEAVVAMGASVLVNLYAVDGNLAVLQSPPALAIVVAVVTSVVMARELERHRASLENSIDALRSSQQREAALIGTVPVTLHCTELAPTGIRYRWLSDNVEQLTGFPQSTLSEGDGISFWISRMHPDEINVVAAQLTHLFATGTLSTEYRWRHADGRYRWLLYQGVLLRSEAGEPREIIGNWLDITERKRMEEELRQSEERYRALVENTRDMISQVDQDGRYIYVSPNRSDILGYRPEDLLGHSPLDFIHPEDRSAVSAAMSRASGRAIFRFRHSNGEWRWIESTGRAYRTAQGEHRAVLASRDVTERMQVEAELRAAKDAAEAASRAKGEFLANMSHEIRTPMNAIIGMTDLALQTDLSPQQREYLDLVRSSADSLLLLINDILDFSKIEAGKLNIDSVVFSLRDAMTPLMRTLNLRAQQRGLNLFCQIAADVPPFLVGDPVRLGQVLTNLIGNALKFTEHGEVLVEIGSAPATEDDDGNSSELHFTVSDTGIGIAPDQLSAVFAPFEQGDGSTTRRYGGTGLGLTICRHLVERMGGRIWVESCPGQGSRFHFTMRFGLPERDALPKLSRPRPAAGRATEQPRGPLRILLAEDNLVNQKLVVKLLEKRGHTVLVVNNGRDAVATVGHYAFDLVLMDVQMPEMDGLEATAAIRARERDGSTHLPIVALTAHAMKGDDERCLAAGMDGYLSKPIDGNDLFATIERMVPAAAGTGSAEMPADEATGTITKTARARAQEPT